MKSSNSFLIIAILAFLLSIFNLSWQIDKRRNVNDIRFVVLETKVEIIIQELAKIKKDIK
jgi:hypothetical protein